MPEQKRQHNGAHSPSDYRPADLSKIRVKGKGSQPDKKIVVAITAHLKADGRKAGGPHPRRWGQENRLLTLCKIHPSHEDENSRYNEETWSW